MASASSLRLRGMTLSRRVGWASGLPRPPVQAIVSNSLYRRQLSTNSLPTILQPSFWRSMLPKPYRNQAGTEIEVPRPPNRSKEWNPATFFIIIFLLIGSQAIQMISLQRNFDLFTYQTDAKLGLLREVVRRVRAGEDVDVEAMLGTGNEAKEREWEDVIKELEEEETRLASIRKARRAQSIAEAKRKEQMSKAESSQSSVGV